MLVGLCDDGLAHIISYLDSESCVNIAHTCWHLHRFTHNVRPTVVLATDAYEAVRRRLLVSFKHYYTPEMEYIYSMKDITNDMLIHIYGTGSTSSIEAAYKLYKRGVFVDVKAFNQVKLSKLIMHAIKHNKHALLDKLKSMNHCGFDLYYSYGYIDKGDFTMGMPNMRDGMSRYHLWNGIDRRMMVLYPTITPFDNDFIIWKSSGEFCIIQHLPLCYVKHATKNDDVTAFNNIYSRPRAINIPDVIKHNAIKIIEHSNALNGLPAEALCSMAFQIALNTTVEMAKVLLKIYGNEIRGYFEQTHNPAIMALLDNN